MCGVRNKLAPGAAVTITWLNISEKDTILISSRISAVLLAAITGAAAFAVNSANAQNYPSKPVRIVVPFTAGSLTDTTTRVITPRLTEMWGQQVVVDNRVGAGGTLGTGIVANSTPDGYTLLAHSNAYSLGPALYPKWKVDMVRDFQAITTLVESPHVLVISPTLGPKNLKDFIAYARKLGDKFNWSSAGVGSGTHFCGEIFMVAAKLKHIHVPYKGTPEAMIDAITGRVNVFFAPLGSAVPFVKDGKALALAVTSLKRNSALPDVPTVDEAGLPGFNVSLWFVLAAPAKTPPAVIQKIAADTHKVLAMPDVIKAFTATGVVTAPRSVEETQKFVVSEIKTLGDIAKQANVPTF
jgi:tripartite-type tricarboxylate transporter receptor subunit TctC